MLCGVVAAAGAQQGASSPTSAASFPSRTVRLVNPFPAGGPLDLFGRVLSERLAVAFGVPVIVESRPGASGNVGGAEVARAPADGHTLLLTLYSIVTSNPHLYGKQAFDPLKDFAPVTLLASYDSVLIVHPSVAAGSVAELVAYAKANPGKLNFASAGKASPGHLAGELFRVRTGAQLTHVPYKGNADAVRSVLAGETQVMFTPTTGALALIKSGKLKVLAVYLTDRTEELPGTPSLQSLGIEGFDARSQPSWYGLLAPAGTPADVIARIQIEALRAMRDEKAAAALRAARIFVVGSSPQEFAVAIRDGTAAWGKVIQETGVKGE